MRRRFSLREAVNGRAARLFAVAARFSTDSAMLVPLGVLLALFRATPAGELASAQLRQDEGNVAAGPAGGDQTAGQADVRAVHVEPDALHQLGDHLLAKAGVSAAGADLRAVQTGFDASGERDVHVAAHVRVGGDHLLGRISDFSWVKASWPLSREPVARMICSRPRPSAGGDAADHLRRELRMDARRDESAQVLDV